ncbi:MAG TPA: iron ABC transporter permease [Phycisphaerales bacterium]|nr:iron ABC transporter permease [Phycisphaerales bacterium]
MNLVREGRLRVKPHRIIVVLLATAVVALVLSPIVHLLFRTLFSPDSVTRIVAAPSTWALLGRSVVLAVLVCVSAMTLGTALAWLTVRPAWPARVRTALLVTLCSTLAVPSYVAAFGLIVSTGSSGLLSNWLPDSFHVRHYPLAASWLVLTCCTYPYVLLTVRSAMLRECGSMEEAALSVGSSRTRAFFVILLPRLAPSVIWGGMLAGLYALADFGAVSLLGYETLTWGIYTRYETAFSRDEARALALILAALALVLISVMRLTRLRSASLSPTAPIAHHPVRLGGWTVPMVLLALLPVMIGTGLPIAGAIDWLSRHASPMQVMSQMHEPAWATMRLALIAAAFVPLLALPIAALHLGRAGRSRAFGRILTPLTLIGFALPGIVVAIAAVGLALGVDDAIESTLGLPLGNRLYQSHVLLMLGYAMLFLPEAVGPLRTGAMSIHEDQFDAASQLGGGPLLRFIRIALPQMMPAFAAAAALVFVTTAKELPATLILAPPGTHTLATRLWGAMDEAYFAQAAAASLMLLGVASVGLLAVLFFERRGAASQD